jgi:hypothetical protein
VLFRTCDQLNLCVWLNDFDIGFVSFVSVIFVFYLVIFDIGYCVLSLQ